MSAGISAGWLLAGAAAGVGSAYLGKKAGDTAAEASIEGAEISADAQQAALDYQIETGRLPLELRDRALTGLGDYYQIPGQQLGQQELIDQARQSPLYASIMGTQEKGEEALMRNASATGGLRSGGNQHDIYKYSQQLEQDALLTAYDEQVNRQDYERAIQLGGVQGLARLDGNQNAIAGLTASIGQTRGQGAIAAGQARQQGTQNAINNVMGIAGLGVQGYDAIKSSDIRLKTDIQYQEMRNGLPWYTWKWNDLAEQIGLTGSNEGVLAHQVYEVFPEAVTVINGFIAVNYEKLGFGESASA